FTLSEGTSIATDDASLDPVAAAYAGAVAERAHLALSHVALATDGDDPRIRFALDAALDGEEYRLEVDAEGIEVAAGAPAGAFWAVQTLLQLPRADDATHVPAVAVHDAPRFAYRGAMLDVARHFFS